MLDIGDKRNRDAVDHEKDDDNNSHVDAGGGDGRGQLTSQQYLQAILEQFPPVMYAFGYGSGVFSQQASLGQQQQPSSTSSSSSNHTPGMLDMIFVVDDPTTFHKQNMKLWPEHYASWLRYVDGGSGLVCSNLQTHGLRSLLPFPSSKGWLSDAHVLFHVVDDKPAWMKYGVISQEDIVHDLTEWESLYIAGRMQKPTLSISYPSDELLEAQRTNLDAATAAALLLSPISSSSLARTAVKGQPDGDEGQQNVDQNNSRALSWPIFFQTVASISYSGDFRMKVGGEDPRKLQKLVEGPGQLSRFYTLYQPSIERLTKSGVISSSTVEVDPNDNNITIGQIEWDSNDKTTRKYLLSQLPHSVQEEVQLRIHHGQPSSSPATSGGEGVAIALAQTLAGSVGPAARNQSFKGLFTLGMRKSIRYAKAKLSKGLFRKR